MTKLIRKTQQPSDYPSNQIHDAYSTSTTDTYSCNYINSIVESGSTEDIIEITPLVGQNYSNYGNTYYYKVGSIVYLHIGLKGLTANAENLIFTLPAGYRPRGYTCGIGVSDNLSSTAVTQISNDGNINIRPSSTYALIDMSFVAMN